MPKLTLCMDIDGTILLARVVEDFKNGWLETDGKSEDVTDRAILCVIKHMARRCEEEMRESLTYEVPGKHRLTYTSLKSTQGGAEDEGD